MVANAVDLLQYMVQRQIDVHIATIVGEGEVVEMAATIVAGVDFELEAPTAVIAAVLSDGWIHPVVVGGGGKYLAQIVAIVNQKTAGDPWAMTMALPRV